MIINFSPADPNFNSDLYAMLTWFEDNVSDVYATQGVRVNCFYPDDFCRTRCHIE
jgi:hypothetical protein